MRAYRNIIDSLHYIKRDSELSYKAEIEGWKTDTEFFDNLGQKHQLGWSDILRNVDTGEFILSSESIRVLQEFITETQAGRDPNISYAESMEIDLAAVERCLPRIKAAARADLRLPSWRA